MAVGPWHARVHKVSCQQKFGARVVENTGLTYGDNIEHLWAWLRKHAHLMKYMAPATRQDFLVVLVTQPMSKQLSSFCCHIVRRLQHSLRSM